MGNRRSLREEVKALTSYSSPRNHAKIPVYLKGREGWGDGVGEESEGTTESKRDRDDIDWLPWSKDSARARHSMIDSTLELPQTAA